jgi:hypothetical protein
MKAHNLTHPVSGQGIAAGDFRALKQEYAAKACEANQASTSALDAPSAEIPRALVQAFARAEDLSQVLARLDRRLRPVMRDSAPCLERATEGSFTEVGGAISQLTVRMEMMIETAQSMIDRAEV